MASETADARASAGDNNERTPLLSGSSSGGASSPLTRTNSWDAADAVADAATDVAADASVKGWRASLWSPANRVLLAGFIISFSFSFTQVSIFYVFRLMECDVFYESHPPFLGDGDRCNRNEVAAGTATQMSILAMSTTFFGTWNLFVAGNEVKHWGPRAALVVQTFVPALRVATQILGVLAGGQLGIWIIQITQSITIFGGPAGYILVVNTIAGEVVPPLERTALFGKLQGCIMLGVALGLLLGGIVGDKFGVVRPFQVAFFLFCFASAYARFAMPYISPATLGGGGQAVARRSGLAGFFQPLKVLLPQKIRLSTGRVANHYGVFFLCCGVFLGVLATGYAQTLLQMYATAAFQFNQKNNGWLLSGYGFMRAVFLLFLFPRIIDSGRAWFARLAQRERSARRTGEDSFAADEQPLLASTAGEATTPVERITSDRYEPAIMDMPTEPEQFDVPVGVQGEEEPILTRMVTRESRCDGGSSATETTASGSESSAAAVAAAADDEKAAYAFDLFFLRWSLLVDGVLTAGAALATQGWHMYLVTVLLPFGSGTAPAAKGVITTMCPASQRTDALNAITLVENIARLATLALFGFIFAALAEVGQAHLTFYFNGALAVVAMLVLMLSHFPPRDSELLEDIKAGDGEGEEASP